jgi:hypothetical protein
LEFGFLNPTTQSHPAIFFSLLNLCCIPFFQPTDEQACLLRCVSSQTNVTPEVWSDNYFTLKGPIKCRLKIAWSFAVSMNDFVFVLDWPTSVERQRLLKARSQPVFCLFATSLP